MKSDRWRRVEDLCHAALARPAEDRRAFLAVACAGDDVLHREVESLLAQESSAAGFMSVPAAAVAGSVVLDHAKGTLVGLRLGSYAIRSLLGVGGMGEVYRARDTKLNRDVALKVLPERFASDPDRLARFTREAQVLASLNHPNIAAIYGLEASPSPPSASSGQAGSGQATFEVLVLELVEGPTLAERIAEAPLPVDQAIPIARQIADALDAAHEHGVIHRDLKPANIKVREDGTVKVLDFGLAKAFQDEGAAPSVMHSPRLSVAATRMGVILGTAAYVAPEQAKGKAVDKRTDIWAFGCVLYEMLTGRPAFEGDDVSEILASVIKGSTNLDLLPAGTHPRVRDVIARCLERDVRRRLRDMGDVRHELEQIEAHPFADAIVPAGRGTLTLARPVLRWIIGAFALAALNFGAAVWLLKSAPAVQPLPTARFSFTLPQNQSLRNTGRPVVAISPDGRQFVYNATGGLYLRPMNGLDSRLIQGTEENLASPFFSPDGQWVGYWSFSDSELKKIPVTGGTAVVLCKATNPYGVSWSPDDTIVFGQPEGIMRVSASGGTPEVVVATSAGQKQVHGPQMLPGGAWLLFSIAPTKAVVPNRWDVAEIVAQSLESGERKVLWRGGSDARYVSTGHLVYVRGDALFALSFALDRMEVSGGPVPLLDGLLRAPAPAQQTGTAHYSFSEAGTLVHATATAGVAQARTLVWVDRKGREEAITAPPRAYLAPRLSPDGTQVALDVRDQENDIWIWNIARQTLRRLTFDPAMDRYPVWTPDGRRIVFSSQRSGAANLFWQAADGTGAAEPVAESSTILYASSVSADGTQVVFEQQGASTDVMMAPLAGERRATSLVATTFNERNADLSADGRWIAYQSDESGRNEVYVRPFPGVDAGRWQLSSGGGSQPAWSSNSRELFYVDPEGRIIAVPIQPGSPLVAGSPQVVVDGPYSITVSGPVGRMYDVSRDGQRFLLLKAVEGAQQTAPPRQIVVVQHWFEELKGLASAR